MSIRRRLLVAIALLFSAPAVANAATITVAWDPNSEADLGGYVLVYGTSPGVYSSSIDVGRATICSVPALSPGTRYYFAVRAYNTAGESSLLSAEVSDVAMDTPPPPDTTAPAVSVTAPATGATLAGTVTVSASASDNVGVAGVQFTIDGVNAGAQDTTAPYTLAWNTTGVANGGHQVGAVARDAAGNQTTAAAVAVTVSNDTTPPTVTGFSPAAGAVNVTTPLTVTATFSEPVDASSVNTSTFELRNGAGVLIAAAVSYNATTRTATLTTSAAFAAAETCTAVIKGGAAGVRDLAGTALANDVTWSFTTSASAGSGLVAAYGFEEGTGTGVGDSSGFGNHGTISGATWINAGRFGKALTFDGVNDWVTVPDAASLDLTNGMTLQAWVYPTAAADGTVVTKQTTGGLVYSLYSYDDAPIPVAYVDATSYWTASGAAPLPLNAWSHLAATYDGTTLRLFVNGTLAGSRAVGNAILASAGPLRIGGNSIWGEYFQGLIDEVRIYNRALVASEIAADMSVAVVPAPADTTAPLVSVTAPVTGATLAGTVTVSASASDNVGVAGVQFTIDGVNAGAEDTTAPYTLAWNTTGVANGGHQVGAVARDAAGNRTTAAAVAVTVSNDTTPPTVTGFSPAAGAVNVTTPLTVTATFSEPVDASSVNTSTFELRNGAGVLIAAAVGYNATTRTATLTTSAVSGAQTCTAVIRGGAAGLRDLAGNALVNDVTWSFTTSAPAGSGLVAAYGFEEGTGTGAGDSSGFGNHGTISGATWINSGRFGKALKFDGVNDWVTVPDAASLDLTNGMTLQAWVYPTAAADGTVLTKQTTDGLAYSLYSYDDVPAPVAYVDATSYWAASGAAPLPLNAWSHLAATYDGTTLRLFVNGTLAGSRAVGNAILTSAGPLRIGGNSLWGEYFQGRIDEVRVYNRALVASEITSDMNRRVDPQLMLAYAFDEGSGTSTTDDSGRGHTGVVSGATWTTSGRHGGALRFDGINDMVAAADSNHLDLAAAMTIEAWVYPTSELTGWRTAVVKEADGDVAYALYANSDTAGARAELNIGGAKPAATNPGPLPVNAWSHLAVTYNGAEIRLFVNGVRVSTTPATGSILNSTGAFRVGGNWGDYFAGLIDEVRIYKRALSGAEIRADMTTPIRVPR
jgi:methionine-rich copper-binding protein CopC